MDVNLLKTMNEKQLQELLESLENELQILKLKNLKKEILIETL